VSYLHVKSSSIEAKIFSLSLGLVAKSSQVKHCIGLVLGIMLCWSRSHEGCPYGLVVSHRNHVIKDSFSDRKLLLAL